MKLIILPLLTAAILGCSSEEPKSLTGSNNSQIVNTNKQPSTGVSFVEIKPASGLKSNKTVKNQKTVEINGSTFEVSGLGGSDTFVEQENNGYVVGGSYVPTPIEEVEGEVASDLALHAFVQKDGVIKDLGTLGGNYSSASGVNSSGVIVGGSHLEDASSRAFKYENNAMSALANLSGGNHSWAYAINSSGHIVGEAKNSSGVFKAVYWVNGNIADLNSLLPAESGWELISAKSISNDGVVSGTGRLNGVKSYFQLNLNLQ